MRRIAPAMAEYREDGPLAALLRMLTARADASDAALYSIGPERCAVLAATPGLRGVHDAAAALHFWSRGSGGPEGSPGPITIDGFPFSAAVPVETPAGRDRVYLLLCDRRPRRMTTEIDAAMRDAATLAFAISTERPPLTVPRPTSARDAILTRESAYGVIDEAIRQAAPGAPLALLKIDLDRFRAINDALGASAGDTLLSVTGARLERATGPHDTLVRLEGDRFVMLASRSGSALREFARSLLEAIGEPVMLAGQPVTIQASIGIVPGVPTGAHVHDTMRRANSALRRAKIEGRNRFAMTEPDHDSAAHETSRLELDLARAIPARQMRLAYQPYVDLSTGRTSGREALMRWRHPERGVILPGTFIPLAENSGLILPLGAWALLTACRDAAAWPTPLILSVNISAMQFRQADFTAQIDAALSHSGLPPERLELEITETVLMRDNRGTTDRIRALIDRGIRIAIDDFGTGYSALAYLTRLPHNRIKLDRAFVQDLANPATADLIRAIVALSRSNGVEITAEGVETPEHLAQVREMGFTHAQGFAVGMPAVAPTAPRAIPIARERDALV